MRRLTKSFAEVGWDESSSPTCFVTFADLVVGGVTGVKGNCDEPLLQAVASPTILFDRCSKGWTLAESFYAASRFVGREDIVIGDPLCAPYAPKQ